MRVSFYNLSTNEDNQNNHKEILNKTGGTYSILEKLKKENASQKYYLIAIIQ